MHTGFLPITKLYGAMISDLGASELAGLGGFPSRVSDSLDLRLRLRICISDKFPRDADTADWGPHFENHWSRELPFLLHRLIQDSMAEDPRPGAGSAGSLSGGID